MYPSILQFRNVFSGLLQNHGFSISNKLHIIMDHSEDYITETKTPLGHVDDHLIEAAHAHMNKRLMASNYLVKDITCENHGEKLKKCVLHINSYNL